MKYLLLFCLSMLLSVSVFGQDVETDGLLTQYTFEDLDSLQAIEEKPIAVFMHTNWCKYCENMKQTTFQHEKIVKLLNKKSYFISFDGESKQTILFRGHEFTYKPTGPNSGIHSLAEALGSIEGQLSYPTFVILNSTYEIIFQYNSFMSAKQMKAVLNSL